MDRLPPQLAERVTAASDSPVRDSGSFVLCWLHHAARDHDNPVLDTAVHLGNDLGKPVLVYQGLGGRHRFNSDRHHAFILEGARDLHAGLKDRGIAYAFHLPTDPTAPGPLRNLAKRACAVVTEDFPAPPFPRWTGRLAEDADCAVLLVDGSCLMPIRSPGVRFTRAYQFRDAATRAWQEALHQPRTDVAPMTDMLDLGRASLGFEPVDLRTADIAELCARCDIDHGIPPVGRITGGSVAGYELWAQFKAHHLTRYDRRRNDAADMEAVSGLSPYLHHGHVSPFRVAREAHRHASKGAEKFLDELLVWRELAFNFCLHTPGTALESLDALPDWAQRTLAAHAADTREHRYSWDTLAAGNTGHALWDHAQRSLVQNGELHNNVRMTWGKAIAEWAPSPEDALRTLIDLNHRFALDGSDPNSYGGLLWCLGQFDRAFPPERPVLGSVRPRGLQEHAERLNADRFASAVDARRGFEPMRVAIVGAGISGLACARVLREHACEVIVFDRGRGPGGRLSTRRPREGTAPIFDHGAPYFTVHDPRLARYVRAWIDDGVCAAWRPTRGTWDGQVLAPTRSPHPCIVGVPGMDALCAHLSRGVQVHQETTISAIDRVHDQWRVLTNSGVSHDGFEAVVLATAPEQSARLATPTRAEFTRRLQDMHSVPVWAGLLAMPGLGDALPDVLDVDDGGPIERLVRNERKPGRAPAPCSITAYATPTWSQARRDADRDDIAGALADAAAALVEALPSTQGVRPTVTHATAHRWGFARPDTMSTTRCLFDPQMRLAACGDGFGGSGVEAAFLSARAAAGRVLALRRPNTQSTQGALFGNKNS